MVVELRIPLPFRGGSVNKATSRQQFMPGHPDPQFVSGQAGPGIRGELDSLKEAGVDAMLRPVKGAGHGSREFSGDVGSQHNFAKSNLCKFGPRHHVAMHLTLAFSYCARKGRTRSASSL